MGSLMYRHEDYETAVEMISSGKIITGPLISANFSFDQYQEAYKFILDSGEKSLKVMIDL